MKHDHTMGDRFKALIAYDPLSGLRHKKHRKEGGRVNIADHIGEQTKLVDTDPTQGQKEAGNYRKGHVKVHGLDISIENPRGSWREGGPEGNRWRAKLPAHYGDIKRTIGGDDDNVDCFIGPHLKSPHVFVIDQHHLAGDKGFDEHKCMIGFGSKKQATEAYHRAFSDGRGKDRVGHVEAMSVPMFKLWLKFGNTKRAVRRASGGSVRKPGATYDTQLSPLDEMAYRQWVKDNNVPTNPDTTAPQDYDMRGFYQGLQQQNPRAQSAVDPNDAQMHYPDYWKTPLHQTFSNESQWAGPNAPSWTDDDKLIQSNGRVVFDDRNKPSDAEQLLTVQRADGGRVHMADGGTPNPFDALDAQAPAAATAHDANPFDALDAPAKPPESSGLSSYIPKAISDIPHEMYQAPADIIGGLKNTWDTLQSRHTEASKKPFFDSSTALDSLKDVLDVGKGVVSAASLPFSPLVGASRSAIGHPMADAEHIVGTIINPSQAAKDNPEQMYNAAKGDVDLALSAARPRGFTPKGPISTPPPIAPEAAANTTAANEFGINLSRGQATQDLDTIRYEDMAARGAYGPDAQKKAAEFFQKQFDDTQAASQSVGQQTARTAPVVDNPADAASAVHGEVSDRAARARALQEQTDRQAATEADTQRGIVADQGNALTGAIRGNALPIENTREAGEIVGQNVRDVAGANREDYRGLYRDFGQRQGEYRVDALQGLGNRIRNDLTFRDEPVIVDEGTPTAMRAVAALDQMSEPRITNLADPRAAPNPNDISGVSIQGVAQMRKRLTAMEQQARGSNNPSDIRAVQAIKTAFDDQIQRAHTEGQYSGDPEAPAVWRAAMDSFSRYRQNFTPRGQGDDVGAAMRRIVERNATPEETANMIIGAGKVGNAGLPVRLADRLEHVLGADSDAWSVLRQAMWQKASQVRNVAGEIDPGRSANSITDFTGSSLGQRMFTGQERNAMRAHAQGIRDLDRNIEQLPATQTAARVRQTYQDTFGGADLGGAPRAAFQKMVEGTATPEEIANGVFKVIGAGNPGHVTRTLQAIERIVGEDSPAMGAIRQGVWQKLTQAAAGKDQPGAQKAMQSINEFLHGSGRTIAEQLYSPQELALMDRYQKALKLTIIPKYARTNSDTAPALLAAVRKYAGMIGSALGLAAEHGSPMGAAAGYGVSKMLDKAGEKFLAARQSKKLNDSLNNVVPPPTKPITVKPRSARVIPLSVSHLGNPYRGSHLGVLQGPVPAGAEDEKNKTKGIRN